MNELHPVTTTRLHHGHHEVAAAIFVGSLVLGAAMVMSAELTKPERYEFHPGATASSYVVYDKDTGRATTAEFGSRNPLEALAK